MDDIAYSASASVSGNIESEPAVVKDDSAAVSNARSWKDFAAAINAAWRKGPEAIIEAARYTCEAGEELDRDQFETRLKFRLALAGARHILYQAPTGSGKTILFSFVVQNAVARGNRVVILGHRQEIVEQIDAALTALDVPHGITAGYPETPDAPVQVASTATLVRRLDRLQRQVDLLIIDEAHHCDLISEGLDVPGVVAAILLRPTESLTLYLQVGRALRPAPGKARALILDHAGNTYRFGPADAPRAWSLEGRAKARAAASTVRRCRACGALNPIAAMNCAECGAVLREPTPPAVRVEVRSGALIEVDRLRAMSYRQVLRWAGQSENRLRLIAQARGYKRGWVWHRLQELRGEQAQ
jgi:Type III restriction enzyme, res subunit